MADKGLAETSFFFLFFFKVFFVVMGEVDRNVAIESCQVRMGALADTGCMQSGREGRQKTNWFTQAVHSWKAAFHVELFAPQYLPSSPDQ